MLRVCTKKWVITAVLIAVLLPVAVMADFIPTNRDTRMPPAAAVFEDITQEGYAFLGQFGDLRYYYRGDRDIIMVRCALGRFVWRTGLDVPFNRDIEDAVLWARTDEELRLAAVPLQQRLNAIWTAMANSLLTIQYFELAYTTTMVSSAAHDNSGNSTLMQLAPHHFRLDVQFAAPAPDIFIPLHIYLSDTGITYEIYAHEITGTGVDRMNAILITPFLGASGGMRRHFDFEANTFGDPEPDYMVPGYAFVPDGSGALMRFQENTVQLSYYTGHVYGENPADAMFFSNDEVGAVERPHPLMPVFGVTQGHEQQAFVAWANKGAEYLEITMYPERNMTHYNFVYPRFVKNARIFQVYNRSGEGFFRLFPERREYDISITYQFLHGEDAGHVGMARAYRTHLIGEGIITPANVQNGTMPLWLDFIMSDVRRSVLGTSNVIATTVDQAEYIVRDMLASGIGSLNGGLLGFQNGGITAGHPARISFNRNIGTRRNFRNFFDEMNALGTDISFAQDYLHINRLQMNIPRNQAFHRNRWGLRAWDSFEPFLPVNEISFARPARSADWLAQQTRRAVNTGAVSHTVSGITNNLVSHWGRRDATCPTETIDIIRNAFANSPVPVNAHSPNQYLWEYTHRFLQAPVFNTQFMISTDTVPFLQLVLHNTMEVYAPYANFSFYTQADILRMIDYNVFPSFVVTYRPAHYLGNTNSLNYYSTEYAIYRDIILNVYNQMSPILSHTMGLEWIDRRVLQNGVILNRYETGVEVVINYTQQPFEHKGIHVPPQSARLFP
ncbi:MAG: DUF5696 domain-containing protein [Defluviitaleaceae bacterium]|nr:DUF5696 domain-containing protein [Defluviitaleaceae bacterium]